MSAKAKILIVEDDTPVAMMIAYLLTRAECEVIIARTAERGMQLAEGENFDLITREITRAGGTNAVQAGKDFFRTICRMQPGIYCNS
jgi:DNA-binding NtrC family response regulator